MNFNIYSNYVNAWSIWYGLKKIKLEGKIKCGKNGLLKTCNDKIEEGDFLFFTEEQNLKKFYPKSNYYKFYPNQIDEKIIDDKWYFAKFLDELNEIPIPYCKIDENKEQMHFPVYLKCRYSWLNDKKMPRGFIVNSESDFKNVVSEIGKSKFDLGYFFIQRLLEGDIENNISVSGFFDSDHDNQNCLVVSRKLYGIEGKITTGCIVETIEDPEKLLARTENILRTMKYTGVFEMEFFYDKKDSKYYVLELNPRFWMQHGIFIDHYDNILIKKYTNKEMEVYIDKKYIHIIWIDNIIFIIHLLKMDIKYLKFISKLLLKGICRKTNFVFYPNFRFTFKYLLEKLYNKILKLI